MIQLLIGIQILFLQGSTNKTISTTTRVLKKTWETVVSSFTGLFSPKNMAMVINGIVVTLVIILVSWLVLQIIRFSVHRWAIREVRQGDQTREKRVSTMGTLILNFSRYFIILIAIILSLQAFNVNLAAIITGAGIVGLAIGFGAQTLVRDLISGFFLIFEGDIAVGDEIDFNGQVGTVEYVGIRVTKIRRFNGELRIIPNGELSNFGNLNRGFMRAMISITVPVDADLVRIREQLEQLSNSFFGDRVDLLMEEPVVQAVTVIGAAGAELRVMFKCKPGQQYDIERDFRLLALTAFRKDQIEIGFPRQVLVMKSGNATT